MELVAEKRDIQTAGLTQVRQATIKAGAHMTAVLAGLYKNPVDAMVREYLTNMYDAWIALQRQNPSAVYEPCVLELPTSLSPYLIFRDYGIGMSLDRLIQNFFAYGDSTKNGNNDEVGGFGLGSKTAFAYGNGQQWIIESRYNGDKFTVMAFIGDNGIQQYSIVSTTKTTERNGVTIRVPIQSRDIMACHTAAAKYVPWYPLDIRVLNSSTQFVKPTPDKSGTNWFLVKGDYRRAGLTVLMGNVPYSVGVNELVSALNGKVYVNAFRNLIEYQYVYLTLPIGSVDIVPSRDDLKYTDRTKKALVDAIEVMRSDVVNEVNAKIANAATQYDALLQYAKMDSLHGLLELVGQVTYKGKTLDNGRLHFDEPTLHAADPSLTFGIYTVRSGSTAVSKAEDTFISLKVHDDHWVIMRDDLPKGAVNIAKGYCVTNYMAKGQSGKLVKYGHRDGARVVLVKSVLSDADLCALLGGIPLTRIVKASSVSGTVAKVGTKGHDALYRFDGGKTWGARVHVPTGGPYYYIPLTQNSDGRWRPPYGIDAEDMMQHGKVFGLTIPVLYGIKSGEESKFDATQWINLHDALKKEIDAVLNADVAVTHSATNLIAQASDGHMQTMHTVFKMLLETVKCPLIEDFVTTFVNANQLLQGSKLASAIALADRRKYNTALPLVKSSHTPISLSAKGAAVAAKYPMLGLYVEMCGRWYSRGNLDKKNIRIIADYMAKC